MLPLVDEANAYCEALGKKARFSVELHTPFGTTGASPLQRLRQLQKTEIRVKLTRGIPAPSNLNRASIWSKEYFIDQLVALKNVYSLTTQMGGEAHLGSKVCI